jgi:hypothetical protein
VSGSNPDAAAAFGQEAPRKPASSLGYWLAGLVAVVAVAGGIGWFVLGLTSLGDKVDDLHRIAVPGQAVVELEAGKQSVYWEGGGTVPPLEIAVREVDGPAVAVGPHGGEVTYEVDGRSGTSVAGFEVDDDGRYLVVVGGERTQGAVAVGKGVGGQIVSAVVGGLGIFFGGLLLCGVVIIITARRRKS